MNENTKMTAKLTVELNKVGQAILEIEPTNLPSDNCNDLKEALEFCDRQIRKVLEKIKISN